MQDVLWNIPLCFGQFDLWSQLKKDFKFLLSFFLHWAHILMRCFFPSFFSDKIKQGKGKSKIGDFFFFFLPVLSCFISHLYLEKKMSFYLT